MLRVIILSVVLLIGIMLIARGMGPDEVAVRDAITLAELNQEQGREYYQRFAKKDGVMEWSEGILVRLHRQGEGARPKPDDLISLHFQGYYPDGRLYTDSQRWSAPPVISLAQTIPGWQTVLKDLPMGSKAEIVLTPRHAYGRPGGGVIGPEQTLRFIVEPIEIIPIQEIDPEEIDPLQQRAPGVT